MDFSACAEHAFEYACALASKLDATLYLMSVISVPAYSIPEVGMSLTSAQIEAVAEQDEAKLLELAEPHRHAIRIADTVLRTGDPRAEIIDTAIDVKADLIVMGTHGRRGLRRALLGSVAETVVRTAPCPVLIVREQHDVRSDVDVEHHSRTDLQHDEVIPRHE